MIDTKKVANRRSLHFERLEDIQAELDRLAAGPIRTLGNWSPGQIFQHLAITMDGSIDGLDLKAPWYLRLVFKLLKGKFLSGKMPAGFKLPPDAEAKIVPSSPVSTEEGLAAYRKAIVRQLQTSDRKPSPLLGTMTVADYVKLHCRHAELHLSFLVPEAVGANG